MHGNILSPFVYIYRAYYSDTMANMPVMSLK